ncbi:pyruvate kinase-like protein [Astrocystis sublimbata]|nr:pyruvate kinase-like protein [Astrocystis sublimbata]
MEVLAVSTSTPRTHTIAGRQLKTAIVRDALTNPTDYIELDATGVVGNQPMVHDGPVYVFFAEHYDYWCGELGVEREAWGWCHWGENITLRFKDKVQLEDEIHVGDVWKIGRTVRLQVCGARIPCSKLAWRCGQKDTWLQALSNSGRLGAYLQVLTGGRVYPGDEVSYESFSGDPLDIASISQLAYDNSLKTRDTINLLLNHGLLMRMNKFMLGSKAATMQDKEREGRHAWKGFRDLRVQKVVDEGGGIKSFYLEAADGKLLANYLPGQFLTVRLPDDTTRSWTISDWVDDDGPRYYRLSIKKAGSGSSWMHAHCAAGTILPARSPMGRFTLDRTSRLRPIYISAGIGITPMLAMMKSHDTHMNMQLQPAVWIHVARDGENLPFQDEIPRFENRQFTKAVFFTKPRPGKDVLGVNYDRPGRPDREAMKDIVGRSFGWAPLGASEMVMEGTFSMASICGPPEFEAAMKDYLTELGFAPPQIRSESFSASGTVLGDLKKATVRFTKSKKTATWKKEEPVTLLELAEQMGLTPDYGCRAGACGSCAVKLGCGAVSGGLQADGTVLTCSAMPASEEIELEI